MDDQRYARFENEVEGLKVRETSSFESRVARLGAVVALAGPLLGVGAYVGSLGTDDPLAQTDMVILALIGVATAVLGVGLFVGYSVIRYFRIWSARIVYELANRPPAADPVPPGSLAPATAGNSRPDGR